MDEKLFFVFVFLKGLKRKLISIKVRNDGFEERQPGSLKRESENQITDSQNTSYRQD